MSSKRSILNRVLYLNLTMAVVLTLVFLCTSGLYARQLTRERYNLASTTLTKVNTDFQLEMNRLDSLLTLCLQDSSLVFSISDRLDTSFFLDNAEDAASRLSLIRQSLPYAKFALKFISLDKFSFAVLARPEDKEEILAVLQEAAEEASKTTRLFAGIREYCTDIRELQTEYRLAENCLLSAQVLPMENFAFQENAAVLPRKRLGQEVQNRLFEYARNGALDQLLPELKEIFYPAGGCSLSDFRFHYQEIWAVFEKACLAKKKAMPHLSDEIPLYNPEYLYQQLARIATESFPSRREQPQNMQQCMEKYIADHLSEPLTLDTVAEAFSITPVYLSSWFKKNLGVNFLNYISAARMERASELLCQPNPPKIYEVALAVGIDNTATFIRQFKKHTGLTPSQYQKERMIQKQQGALLTGKTLS